MNFTITSHARQRMELYGITELQIKEGLNSPDSIIKGQKDRKIAQKALNGYILRIIYEEKNESAIIITAYKARRERYEI